MGRSIKWTYDLVNETLKSMQYVLVTNINSNIGLHKKIVISDSDGYYYYKILADILKHPPQKVGKQNPYTIQNIQLWCKLNNKPFKLVSTYFIDAKSKLEWKCLNENCGEIFKQSWSNISSHHGCGCCNGKQVGLSNCLAIKNPKLASEWHPTLNGNLTPYDVVSSSNKYVWWQCGKNPKHEWKAPINNRNIRGDKCPYCSGKLPSEDYNLLVCNPILCEEWDYIKNSKRPEKYTPMAKYEVWWKCKECGHEWKVAIAFRKNRGCPECNKSHGEIKIKECLKINNILFESQKEFQGLIGLGNGLLSYDFYLPRQNYLIEFQGVQHEKPTDFKGKGKNFAKEQFIIQQEHDKRKREYAKQNNYNLLEIWYWDFDRIEEILSETLGIQNKQKLVKE